MKFLEAASLLSPEPLHLEMGYERLDEGVLHVACRTDLHACTGEMFEWWFRFRPDTQKYIWWHPVDHVFSDWIECRDGTHVGSIHVVEEYFTGLPAEKLAIQFRDATEFFDPEAYRDARGAGAVTAAVCARIGLSHAPPRDSAGGVLGGRLLHMGRDTPWGCALRSHFYLGQDLPARGKSPQEIATGNRHDISGRIRPRVAAALLQRIRLPVALPTLVVHCRESGPRACRGALVRAQAERASASWLN